MEKQKQDHEDGDELENTTVVDSLPPPKSHSPPHRPQSPPNHNLLNPQSPPPQLQLEYPPQEEAEDEEKPPFKPPITPAVDTAVPATTKVGPTSQEVDEERGVHVNNNNNTGGRNLRPNLSILKRVKRENMVKRASIGFRVCGFVFSLVSFSVMASDKNRGWALDSFYRYKEFRYCMAVNVIAFVYSGLHAFDLAYQLTTGKRRGRRHLQHYIDFALDQILTYLLLSASTSAAIRVDDWQSNWGKDEFTDVARASVGLSFIAFVALALSSLISGHTVCTLQST